MNMKTTLTLLIVAIVLGGLALYRLKVAPPTPPGEDDTGVATGERLLDPASFDPEAIDRIEVVLANSPAYTFEKRDDGWYQVEPVEFRMQDWAIRGLATAAADLESVETIEA